MQTAPPTSGGLTRAQVQRLVQGSLPPPPSPEWILVQGGFLGNVNLTGGVVPPMWQSVVAQQGSTLSLDPGFGGVQISEDGRYRCGLFLFFQRAAGGGARTILNFEFAVNSTPVGDPRGRVYLRYQSGHLSQHATIPVFPFFQLSAGDVLGAFVERGGTSSVATVLPLNSSFLYVEKVE